MKMKNKYQRGFFNMFFVFFIILLTACNESKNDDNSSKINTPPSALNDNIRLQIDESASIDVLENDIDPDGKIDNKTLTITQPPLHGEANVSDAKINYSPDENYFGHDQIRYQISDNKNASAEALVFIFINKPPTANDDDISVAAGFPVTFDPLDNDYDSDGYINKTDSKIKRLLILHRQNFLAKSYFVIQSKIMIMR
jgi:hypothetical protein